MKSKNKKNKGKKLKNKALLSWKAPEFIYYERGFIWKIIALSFVIGSSVLAFLAGAWSFSLLILVFSVVYYLVYFKKPKMLNVEIKLDGISYGKNFYKFELIKNFWIIYNPPFTRALYLKVNGQVFDEVKIVLPNQSPESLREILKLKIKEIPEKEETVRNIFFKILKIS